MDEAMVARPCVTESCAECARLGAALEDDQRRAVARWLEGVSALPHDERLHAAVAALAVMLDVHRASLLLRVGPRALRVAASSDTRAVGDLLVDLARYPELATLLEERRPVLVADVTAAPELAAFRPLLAARGVVSLAAVPLRIAGTDGLLRISSTRRHLTPTDLAALELTAHRLQSLAATAPQPSGEADAWVALALRMADAVLEITPDGRVLHAHEPTPPRLGLPAGWLCGRTIDELLPPDDHAAARTRLLEVLDGEGGSPTPLALRLAGRLWVQAWGVPVGGPTPRLRVALQRLPSIQDHLAASAAFQDAPTPLLLTDPDGSIRAANPPAAQLLGESAESLAGRDLAALLGAADDPVERRGSPPLAIHLPLGRHDGFLVPLVDLRHHELAREREARLRSALQAQQDRLDRLPERLSELEGVKGRFLAASAHELKTPLTVLDSYLQTLLGDLAAGLSPEQLEFLEVVREAVLRLRRLVVDLVDIAALDAGSLHLDIARVAPGAVVEAAARELAGAAQAAGVDLRLRLPAVLPAVRADRARLHQVLSNLIDNGVKFTREGGSITVTAADDDDTVRITVADTGVGIAPEHHRSVFEDFQRLPAGDGRARPGAGLGLAVCRRIVRSLGGRLTLESSPGTGARFTVHLPRWPEGDAAPA